MSETNLAARIPHINERLEIWSEYIVTGGTKGLSSVPSFMRLVHAEYRSSVQLPVSYDEYNEINLLVEQLPEILKRVVFLEWCENGTRERKAKREKISRQTFTNRLHWAYTELLRAGL